MPSPEAQVLWQQYVAAERNRIREVLLPALGKFIEAVLGVPEEPWKAWARDFAEQVSEGKSELPVPSPSFGACYSRRSLREYCKAFRGAPARLPSTSPILRIPRTYRFHRI
jgi:hypothetical protein